jgi:predicted phage terminase large subunit-like protein
MATIDVSLHQKQMEIFQSPKRFRVVGAGRRGGKSYLSAVELLIEGLKTKNEHGIDVKTKEVWYVAPTFQQGKDIMWNLLKEMGKDVIESTIENTATIKLINGRTIKIKGSDRPDTLRGVGISFVVMDEYAFMKPEVWDLIIRPTLSDVRGRALFIGTPEGKNHFYELWVDAANDTNDEWAAFHFCSIDNPIIDPGEIEAARNTMTAEAFRQEYEASFEAAGGGVFKEDYLKEADDPSTRGTIYIAYDPAGYSDGKGLIKSTLKKLDEHAIVVAEVTSNGWFIHDVIHGRWDIREASVQLIRAAQTYRPAALGIEKGSLKNAIMPYLEDQMRRIGVFPRIEELTHGGKKKQERIMWALQGRFQHGRIVFKKGSRWIKPLVTQLLDFPNPMVHDDLIDALAYIDQISTVVYQTDLIIDDFEPLDEVAGY